MTTRIGLGKNGQLRKLNREARAMVEKNSDRILCALLKAIEEGRVMSARLLLELADLPGETDDNGNNRRLAIDLATEPQWPDDVPREDDPPGGDADEEAR
jgi:hypothetical protein